MDVIGIVLMVVALLIIVRLRDVWLHYKIVGQLLDILGVQTIQDRLFNREKNIENLRRTAQQYVMVTRYVPPLIIGAFIVIAVVYVSSLTGSITSVISVVGALILAGVVTWLLNFEAVPHWLYDWHLTVLMTRSALDIEAVHNAIQALEQSVESGEYDDLSENELEFISLNVRMLEEAHEEAQTMYDNLKQQQIALRSTQSKFDADTK
jgi:hypothetical protein